MITYLTANAVLHLCTFLATTLKEHIARCKKVKIVGVGIIFDFLMQVSHNIITLLK